jgi:hypothetical protein
MREGKLRHDVERAAKAEALLRDPTLVEAFDNLEANFIEAWRNTSVADTDNRERIYHLLSALQALKGQLHTVIEGGKVAQANLDNAKT